jgi:hypothetical protein
MDSADAGVATSATARVTTTAAGVFMTSDRITKAWRSARHDAARRGPHAATRGAR